MPVPRAFILLLCLVVTLSLSACHEHCETDGDPAIETFTAEPMTVEPGGEISLTMTTTNFPFSGGEDDHSDDAGHGDHSGVSCGGHYHVYLDSLDQNPLAMLTTEAGTATLPGDITVGEHTLIGRLHNGDHTIVEPQVTSEVTITVE